MPVLVPVSGTCLQDRIIVFLGLLNDAIMADVAPDLVTMMIESEQGEKAGNTAVGP
jgi:hypothetical protein